MRLRRAVPEDAEALAATIAEGFDGYREFAPRGWEPPRAEDELDGLRERLGREDTWCLVAETEAGQMAGHVAFLPAAISRRPDADPRLAHFWQLFVRRSFWGSGAAGALHRAAVEEAAARGFARLRLFTPAGQLRARRFYEREGWTLVGESPDEGLGIPLVEYRLDLR